MEAMIISMHVSPEKWRKNPFLERFMERTLSLYPQFSFYRTFKLPTFVQFAYLDQGITVDMSDKRDETWISAAVLINAWLLRQMTLEIKVPSNASLMVGSLLIGAGIFSGMASGALLTGILNIGVLFGAAAGSFVLAASCIGMALLLASALFIGVGWYQLDKRKHGETLPLEQDPLREMIVGFLKNNGPVEEELRFEGFTFFTEHHEDRVSLHAPHDVLQQPQM